MTAVEEVMTLLRNHGHSEYGGEAVTQLEHALQTAWLAEQEDASIELIAAALLHDIGHLLHNLPDDAPDHGVDDQHEAVGHHFLSKSFPEAVYEPVRLHVTAKRYLCATEPAYLSQLSVPSLVSLRLQGGPMSPEEVKEFRRHPFADDAIRLRKWDDEAKMPGRKTPTLEHYAGLLHGIDSDDPSVKDAET